MSSPAGTGWQLGIDFGTSNTVAAIASPHGVSVVDIESNGQSRMPSSVFLTEDGDILVGTAAQHQAVFAPERFEPTPKRCLGEDEIFLGTEMVPVTTLIAGVLRRVFVEACRQRGETLPDAVRLTHPATWGQARLSLLDEAARRAGLPPVQFVAEPVAAAVWIAGAATTNGDHIAVYDFGGGTFDAAVLRRFGKTFEVAGPPVGRDPLGGEDIDRRIIDYIGTMVSDEAPEEWQALRDPPDVAWRRRAAALRMEVQRAKETLSEVNSCQLWIPGLERELQLTRPELEKLIAADIDACTDTLLTALSDASVEPETLHGLYLVGGSSRIPLVAESLWRRVGVRPLVQDSPKSVVALGAARWTTTPAPQQSQAEPSERTVVTVRDAPADITVDRVDAAGRVFVPPTMSLSLLPEMRGWDAQASVQIALERLSSAPATIRLREEACELTATPELAMRLGAFRAARSQGYREVAVGPAPVLGVPGAERRFFMTSRGVPVPMVERYLVAGGRAIVMAFPEEVRGLADAFTFAGQWPAPEGQIKSPVLIPRPTGWRSSEQLHLVGYNHAVLLVAERHELPNEPIEAWRWHRLESLLRAIPQSGVANRIAGTVLNELPGEIVTVRWVNGQIPTLTKLGTATASGHGFSLSLTLPLAEQADFGRLAKLAGIAPFVKG
jgi:molecular chaperone DnaK